MAKLDESHGEPGCRLILPTQGAEWARVKDILSRPLERLTDLDAMLTDFAAMDEEPKICEFFDEVPGSGDIGDFDCELFFRNGAPLMIEVALAMPELFENHELPICKTNSASRTVDGALCDLSLTLTRRQCACLLAHSFFGSLKRPEDVERNNWRFTVKDLFVGSAMSPNSATTFLNYFTELGLHGFPDGLVTIQRLGFQKSQPPWTWDDNDKPLCQLEMQDGPIEDAPADMHAEFANCFIGGGVMTGDFCMEEILFLVKPELMVAMALQNRMADTEAIRISGALQYSRTRGYGSSLELAGAGPWRDRVTSPPTTVCAMDAIRGGGPAMSEVALRRDMNKARIAFEGAREIASGHWGCGAFGNNHDLMFLKQWLAASEAGARVLYYHEYVKGRQSHSIVPLSKRLKHLTVGQLWQFLKSVTASLQTKDFSSRMSDLACGKLSLETCAQAGEPDSGALEPAVDGSSAALLGSEVLYQGEKHRCIKQNAGQLRLQRGDGRTTWASASDVQAL